MRHRIAVAASAALALVACQGEHPTQPSNRSPSAATMRPPDTAQGDASRAYQPGEKLRPRRPQRDLGPGSPNGPVTVYDNEGVAWSYNPSLDANGYPTLTSDSVAIEITDPAIADTIGTPPWARLLPSPSLSR